MSKLVELSIDLEGNVKIEKLEGYGAECAEATQILEKALGKADESSRVFTDEVLDRLDSEEWGYIEL